MSTIMAKRVKTFTHAKKGIFFKKINFYIYFLIFYFLILKINFKK